jgi:hypothetical protein
MAKPQMMGGNKVDSPKKVENDKRGTNMNKADAGLRKFMPGHGFHVGSSPGAPTVQDGGWNNGENGGPGSNAEVTGPTDMRLGSRMRPTKGSNIYCSADYMYEDIRK